MATFRNHVRELRTPLIGNFRYVSGCGNAGQATWIDISRAGAAVRLGRYLRPGHLIQVQPAADDPEQHWAIPARIIWCSRIPGTLHFRAGLAIDRSCPETALRFATLGYEALALNKNNNCTVTTVGWSSNAAAPTLSPSGLTSLVQAV